MTPEHEKDLNRFSYFGFADVPKKTYRGRWGSYTQTSSIYGFEDRETLDRWIASGEGRYEITREEAEKKFEKLGHKSICTVKYTQ